MRRGTRPRRAVGRTTAILAAAVTILALVPSYASAHPNLIGTSPKDGSQLSGGPSSIVIYFDEKVTMAVQGTRIVDGSGKVIPSSSKLSNKNKTLTITPTKRLGKGMFAAAYNVTSVEGHFVPGAIAFTVATPTQRGSSIKAKPIPNIPTTLDGDRVGVRTVSFPTTKRKGQVTWRSPVMAEPLFWTFKGNGTTASATGVLPFAGTWTFEIDLSTKDSVMIPKGTVTLK